MLDLVALLKSRALVSAVWKALKAWDSGGTSEVKGFGVCRLEAFKGMGFWMPLKAWDSGGTSEVKGFGVCRLEAFKGMGLCFHGRGGLKTGEIFSCLGSDA
ncbi:uncharacterized protein G2W53_034042 [Senna tora]|uniref:Uncharacterized protein n=1 Tax=Senna tora TaxID=362788 RepID=A0A834WBI9_9FABA|nr:uncharacterized protein G2W53_034042 [Senna tora]